jgi:hypothetical protein
MARNAIIKRLGKLIDDQKRRAYLSSSPADYARLGELEKFATEGA